MTHEKDGSRHYRRCNCPCAGMDRFPVSGAMAVHVQGGRERSKPVSRGRTWYVSPIAGDDSFPRTTYSVQVLDNRERYWRVGDNCCACADNRRRTGGQPARRCVALGKCLALGKGGVVGNCPAIAGVVHPGRSFHRHILPSWRNRPHSRCYPGWTA